MRDAGFPRGDRGMRRGQQRGPAGVVARGVQTVDHDPVKIGLWRRQVKSSVAASLAAGNENKRFDSFSGWALKLRQLYLTIEGRDLIVNIVGVREPSRVRRCRQ